MRPLSVRTYCTDMVKIKGFSLDSRVCSLVKEAGSLVNEVKWNIFGSSFIVLDSGLGSEMGDPSHRNLGGKSVKPTQNSISTSGAVNRVRGHWSASKSD
ncbi:unnamed protein product [Brassica rapa subsp. trilocularis]